MSVSTVSVRLARLLSAAFGLFCFCLDGQTVHGRITDQRTGEAVPFALVYLEGGSRGTTADVDGSFTLNLKGSGRNLVIQAMGYKAKLIPQGEIMPGQTLRVQLENLSVTLGEIVIVPGEDPARAVIRKVIDNMETFDISLLPHYYYRTYSKTYFTLSDRKGNEEFFMGEDSAMVRDEKKIVSKNYLMLLEAVTERKYRYRNKYQEKVIASRASGFSEASFGTFASELQSPTFYRENIEVLGARYLNPLSEPGFRRYRFAIADTVVEGADTTVLIRFSPARGRAFSALKGVLYININQHVLANVIAGPAAIGENAPEVKIQQRYTRIDTAHWFPSQANTEILFHSIGSDDRNKKDTGVILKVVSRIYTKDISLDTTVRIKNAAIVSLGPDKSGPADSLFWNRERADSLTAKEKETFRLLDSIGRAAKFDRRIRYFQAVTTGRVELGYLSLDLEQLIRLNDFEGPRPGLGFWTSDKVSRWLSVGAYGAYGLKDQAFKYGGAFRLNFNRRQNVYLLAETAHEVTESAGTGFLDDRMNFTESERFRDVVIDKMDQVNFGRLSFRAQIFNVLKASVYVRADERQSPAGFLADPGDLRTETYRFSNNEAGIQLRYLPDEKFRTGFGQPISIGGKWPIFFVNLSRGLPFVVAGVHGKFEYSKIDLRIDHRFRFPVKGGISYQLQAGQVFGRVPYSLRYNNKGSRSDSYYLSAAKTFETMYANEFVSTKYAAFFFSVNSGRLFRPSAKFNPEIELVHNYGIGEHEHPEDITGMPLSDISKGYTEAGLRLRHLVKASFATLGAGIHYRYGNYAYEEMSRNFTYKLVLGFGF